MEKKYNFVYVTTNLINGKQYIGDHSTDKEFEEDYYYGSGKAIVSSFKKYGRDNFKLIPLEYFKTKQESFDAQERYITKYNSLVPNGYNISPKGGCANGGNHSEISKQKISIKNKGHSINKGRKPTEEQKQRMKDNHHSTKGMKYTLKNPEQHRENVSKAMIGIHKGRTPWNKGMVTRTKTEKEYRKEYYSRPEVKERYKIKSKEYYSRPEVKERRKIQAKINYYKRKNK